jgi:alkylated DNA repair dioxygenase AlkB
MLAKGLKEPPANVFSEEELREMVTKARVGGKRDARGAARHTVAPKDGAYQLNDQGSYIVFQQGAVAVTPEAFDRLWEWGVHRVSPTPNPRNPEGPPIRRRQATFGHEYRFGAQTSQGVTSSEAEWPEAVRVVLDDARRSSSVPDTLEAVHVNWYPDGQAALAPHSDDEKEPFKAGLPIFSYTLLSDPSAPRGFQIYRAGESVSDFDIPLGHGDLLIMMGNMQQTHKHGVKKTSAQRFKALRRINLTVRSLIV